MFIVTQYVESRKKKNNSFVLFFLTDKAYVTL